MVFPLLLINL